MPNHSAPARRAKSRNEPTKSNPPPETNGFQPAAYKLKPAAAYIGGLSVPTMMRLVRDGRLRPCRQVMERVFATH